MNLENDYENALLEESYFDFLARKLASAEKQSDLLEEEAPGSGDLHKYLQLSIVLRRQLEEARAMKEQQVGLLPKFMDEVAKGVKKVLTNEYVKNNPQELPRWLDSIVSEVVEKYNREEISKRKEYFRARNEWLKQIGK